MFTVGKVHGHRRRGIVAITTAVLMMAIVGFAALTIDVGLLYTAKAELQSAADAAALAGASAFFTDSGLSQDEGVLFALVASRAQQISLRNRTLKRGTLLELGDIAIGQHDEDDPTGSMLLTEPYNAVEVTVRLSQDSPNGPVPFVFAPIWNIFYGEVSASARAMGSDRLSGFRLEEDWAFIPFTIHEEIYEDMASNGPDEFMYDEGVFHGSDGVHEVKLFPWKKDMVEDALDEEIAEGNGNFGTLNIGLGSQGTSFLEGQIRDGITAAELQAEFGTSELTFLDENNEPTTYFSTGNPGLSAGMKNTVAGRLGDLVGFFLHKTVVNNGSNAVYEITGIRFGRIVEVELTGKPENRSLRIQPVAYMGDVVVIDEDADSTGGQIGRVMLVQ